MSQAPDVFVVDRGEGEVHGWKIGEVRRNGMAIMVIACDHQNCNALHLHILMEEDEELFFVTTLSTEDQEAMGRSSLLFRAMSMIAYGNLDLENVTPNEQAPKPRKKIMDIIPGLTPWGKA